MTPIMLCCAPGCYARNASDYGGVPLCPGHFKAVAACVPPPPPPKPKPVVYYITRSDRPGQVKIGTTKDMKTRMRELGARGRTVKVLATEPGDRKLEAHRHAQFVLQRVELEWFTLTGPLLVHIHRLQADTILAR